MQIWLEPVRSACRATVLALALAGASASIESTLAAEGRAAELRSQFGNYLAGRVARGQHDTSAAADYYERALDRDPTNIALLEQAMLMDAVEGHHERAGKLALSLVEKQPAHRVARLILAVADANSGKWASAHEHFKAASSTAIGELTSALARGWALAAQGELKAAMDALDSVKQAEWAQFYVRYHRALINDWAGRRQEAKASYERIFKSESKVLRVALAYAHHASASGDQKLARSIIEEHIKNSSGTPHPSARALADKLKSNDKLGILVETPEEGLTEVFYGLGEALAAEGSAGLTIGSVYLQLGLQLKKDSTFALAALAGVYESMRRYDAAIETYDRIPASAPVHAAVQIRKALNLNQLERVDEAKTVLERLAAENPSDIRALDALGGIMRGHKRFAEAVDYYTRIINTLGPKPEKRAWTYFYGRGTSYERLKKWPLAEADLQKALQLAPDQPLVLNYLGYSWVDQNKNLKQGLALIEKAVNLKPDDGYIVDSLGWAHYRLGNFKEAVKWLERAVELRPEDPVLNDHLGDAFWRVGRRLEARYQWEQALTLKPEAEEIEKIKAKIAKGLPAKGSERVAKRAKDPAKAENPKKQTRLAPPAPADTPNPQLR